MKKLLGAAILVALTLPAQAAIEWSAGPQLTLGDEPVAIVEAADGQRLFVLTKKGSVLVLTADGRREAEIPLGFKADSISLSADGSRLLLGERATRTIHTLALEERYRIPLGGSPFKGEAAAAVAVVVFSDFQ